jgi:sentrin-specific protease 1
MLFFPINQQFHWKLVIIDIQNRVVYYLDSYNNTGLNERQTIFEWFRQYCDSKSINIEINHWESKDILVPPQYNNFDCGVFVLMYAEFIADGCLNPQTFNESDMTHFRKLIAINIFRGSINYDLK